MIRRRFLGLITMAGATGVSALATSRKNAAAVETATYKVNGFTCITCATGLETLLGREKGVVRVDASYAKASATVQYHPEAISEATIRGAIESMGFHASLVPKANS